MGANVGRATYTFNEQPITCYGFTPPAPIPIGHGQTTNLTDLGLNTGGVWLPAPISGSTVPAIPMNTLPLAVTQLGIVPPEPPSGLVNVGSRMIGPGTSGFRFVAATTCGTPTTPRPPAPTFPPLVQQ